MSVSPGLHPGEAPRPGDSHAEARVHEALRRQLPAGWFAWHSPRIRGTDGIQGEGDFVIAVPDRDGVDHVEVVVLDLVGLTVGGSCCRFCNNRRAVPTARPRSLPWICDLFGLA